MSRILTPKGWRELELNEHHELAEHKGDKSHKHPHEKDEVGVQKESMLGFNGAAKANGGKSLDPRHSSSASHIDYHHRQTGGHNKTGGDQDRHRYQVAKKLGYKTEGIEEKYTDAQRAAKEKSRVGDRMHGGSGVVGKEKAGNMAGHSAQRRMRPAGSAKRDDFKRRDNNKDQQAKLKTDLQKKRLNQGDENPANSQHLCAKNVVHEEYGEGSCISEQHAEPDRYGHVAWYDVMFEHGIEERLPVNEVKVTEAEDHMHASYDKKKKGK